MNKNNLQSQVKYMWDRLDDLASSDPQGYKKFIEQQMKEREEFMAPPEPCLCMKTHAEGNKATSVYINICGWKRIPYPKDDNEPLKLMCGFIKKATEADSSKYVVVPVAANAEVLNELLKSNWDKHELLLLVIDLVSKQFKMDLSKTYSVCKDLFKGDVPANPRSLFISNPNSEVSQEELMKLAQKASTADILATPENLLKTLSCDGEPNETVTDQKDFIKNCVESPKKTKLNQNLIEEIDVPSVINPSYTFEETTNCDETKNLILRIHLPLVSTTSECDLNISTDEVELYVPGAYSLKVMTPKQIDDAEAQAKFHRRSRHLVLTMPITSG